MQEEQRKESTPSSFAETPPRPYPGTDYNWTIQALFDIQNTLGRLEQSVSTLSGRFEKQETKLDSVSHKVYAASVIGGILLALSGVAVVFLSKIWDVIVPLLQIKPHP
jgi:hypothetical protein